jgi:hypothetical protein
MGARPQRNRRRPSDLSGDFRDAVRDATRAEVVLHPTRLRRRRASRIDPVRAIRD